MRRVKMESTKYLIIDKGRLTSKTFVVGGGGGKQEGRGKLSKRSLGGDKTQVQASWRTNNGFSYNAINMSTTRETEWKPQPCIKEKTTNINTILDKPSRQFVWEAPSVTQKTLETLRKLQTHQRQVKPLRAEWSRYEFLQSPRC